MAEHQISKTGILKLLANAGVSEQAGEAAERYRSGLSLAKVSEQAALPRETVRQALVDAGVQMRPRGRTPARRNHPLGSG
jgi:hypothetical protein